MEVLKEWSNEPLKSTGAPELEEFHIVEEPVKGFVEENIKKGEKEVKDEEISGEVMTDTLLQLKTLGIEDDNTGFLRELIKLKKANVDQVVDTCFNLKFQKVMGATEC